MARVTRGHGIAAIVFGVIEVIIGIIIIICGFVAASKVNNSLYSTYWAGFVFLVPGILGIITGATKSNGCMIAFMVLNIITFIILGVGSIAIFIFLGTYATVLNEATSYCFTADSVCYCTYRGRSSQFNGSCVAVKKLVVALWASAICCLLAAIVTLASSILGCASSCCTASEPTGIIVQEHLPAGYPSGFAQQPPQYQPPQGYQPAQPYQPPQVKSGAI